MVQVIVGGAHPSLWTWLGPLLLFGGSLVASGVAFFGIRASNRTNRAAITAADNRANVDRAEAHRLEFNTWRRDTLLRVGFEATEAAHTIEDRFRAITHEAIPANLPPHLDAIEAEVKRISASYFYLRLIGAHEVAERCRDINKALANRELQSASLEAHSANRRSVASENAGDMKAEVEVVLRRQMLDHLLDGATQVRGDFAESVEQELRTLTVVDQPPPGPQTPAAPTG